MKKNTKVQHSFNLMFGSCLTIIGFQLMFITNYTQIFIKVMWNNVLLNRYSYNEILLHNKWGRDNFSYLNGLWLDFVVCGLFLIVIPLTNDTSFKKYYGYKAIKKKICSLKRELSDYRH